MIPASVERIGANYGTTPMPTGMNARICGFEGVDASVECGLAEFLKLEKYAAPCINSGKE
jgi:hypothetical protein